MRIVLSLVLLAAAALPQEPAAPVAPAEQPAEANRPELHKIYVPYKKLEELLGTDKERVMVPYKEFLELWQLKYGPKAVTDKPPVPFAIESAAYEGRVQEGIAAFRATIEIEVYAETWQRIPLPFSRIAFEEVTVDGKPGVLTPAKHGYDLLLRGKGRHTVEARFVAGIAKGKEYATCEFGLPAVPLHRLSFRVPGKGTEVKLEPARAHTVTTEGEETLLLAFLGPQPAVKLTWRFQPEEKDEEPPLVFATDVVDVTVEERVLRGTIGFDLQVLRTAARAFTVRVPEGVQVLEVTGANIKTWGFADGARRNLRVELHQPALGQYPLGLSFEQPIQVPGALALPVFAVAEATRERGFVRVRTAEGVGVRPTTLENVFQADLNALPEPIRGGERALGFRFPALPYALGLATERIRPLVSLLTRARLQVERRTVKLDTALQFTVERAGLFSLRVVVPAGLQLTDIGDPKLIDSYRETEENGKRILTLDLRGRRIGTFTLPIRGEAPLDLDAGALEVPLLEVLDVDREEGTLGVYMDPGIKAAATVKNVIPLEPEKLAREDRFASPLPLSFAWRWRGKGAAVSFKVEKRKPKVTCDVRYRLQAEEARVRVRAELVYNVEYSGVETFRFRVPKSIVERLKVDGRNVREKPHADDEVKEGEVPTATYTVTLQGPALGQVVLTAEYDEVFPQPLKVNDSWPVAIARILPLDVEQANTFVAIRKSPAIKVDGGNEHYEQIDPAELPQPMRGDDVFMALRRFDEPMAFPLDLTKHEYQPVADLVVRHVHLETVLADEKTATTTAYFEILNNDRQFLALELPEGAEVLDLLVAGKPEKLRLGADGVQLVPLLTGLRKDATFVVAIAYEHPVATEGAVAAATAVPGPVLPAFEEMAAPRQLLLTWSVHYPRAWKVTSFGGNVTPAGADADEGSWLRRAIELLGQLVRPAGATAERAPDRRLQPAAFQDIVPMYKERESVRSVFTNGVGNGRLEIRHTSAPAHVAFILLAALFAAGAVIWLARAFKPLHAGGALVLATLLLLAFAGRAWTPVWNGALAGAVLATLFALFAARKRRTA